MSDADSCVQNKHWRWLHKLPVWISEKNLNCRFYLTSKISDRLFVGTGLLKLKRLMATFALTNLVAISIGQGKPFRITFFAMQQKLFFYGKPVWACHNSDVGQNVFSHTLNQCYWVCVVVSPKTVTHWTWENLLAERRFNVSSRLNEANKIAFCC